MQNRLATELEEYLTRNGFSMETRHPLGPTTLKSPTGKDFNFVFQWLYKRIDPAYQFQKSIEHEVPAVLKQLRYPFEKSITKSQLSAVGGNNWGNLLGMLHWLMQVAIMMERYGAEQYDDACAAEGVDVSGDRITFRFLTHSYGPWLQCPQVLAEDPNDEDEVKKALEDNENQEAEIMKPYIQTMVEEFRKGNEKYIEELKVIEAENEALRKQIEEIERNTPDVTKLDEIHKILKSDVTKFEDYNSIHSEKIKKHEQRNSNLREETVEWDNKLKDAIEEKKQLQQAIDRQGISMADIDQMNTERRRLKDGVEAAKARLEETNQKIKEQELETSDKLTQLEALVRQFNSLCYDVGLRDEAFELVVKVHESPFSSSQFGASQQGRGDRLVGEDESGYQASRILNLDLRGNIKAAIVALREDINTRRNTAKDQDEEHRNLLFKLSGAMDDKRHEIEALEHKVRSAEEEFERTRDVSDSQVPVDRKSLTVTLEYHHGKDKLGCPDRKDGKGAVKNACWLDGERAIHGAA